MVDVFISYSKSDKDRVAQLAKAIEAEGYAVWWDEELPPHLSYGEVIIEKIENAKAAIVVWSSSATKSEWVRAEADAARNQRKLIQTALSDIIPPLPFNQIQCADLSDWNGEADHSGWRKVKASLVALCGEREAPAAATAPDVSAPAPETAAPAVAATAAAATPPPPPAAASPTSPPRPQTLMGGAGQAADATPTPNPGHPSAYRSAGKSSGNNMMPLFIAGGVGGLALLGAVAMYFTSGEPEYVPDGADGLVNVDGDTSANSGAAIDTGKPGDDVPPVAVPDNSQASNQGASVGDGYNRDVTLINQSGDTIMFLYWSNVNADNWGQDQLGSQVMADGQNWFVTIDDGSGACQFDFRAETATGMEIERRNVNVCQVSNIYFN